MTSLFVASSQPKPSKDYLVATNDNTSVFVRRSDATRYQDLVTMLVVFFPSMNSQSVVVQTNELDICAGRHVDIPPDLWPEISPQIQNIKVISRPTPKRSTTPSQSMIIHVQCPSGETRSVSVPRTASIHDLKSAIKNTEGTPIYMQLLMYQGQSLMDESKLSEYGISDKTTVLLQHDAMTPGGMPCPGRGRGIRKPVIYLFSPRQVRSTVRVSLVNAWSFSVVYPSVPIKDSELGQSIAWDVNTHEDHSLTTNNGTRVSYLFWEAEPKSGVSPPSPPPSPRNTVVPFDPLFPQVHNENSVVLRASQAAEYLDRALSALCLPVEARTSFITYWLPSILKHDYVALHFLPQASYEHAAPLDVEPKPDIVTRVFMLFTRVCEDELVEWEGALSRAFESADIWKGIVGVDGHKAKDEGLFRVLEWGGMEVAH